MAEPCANLDVILVLVSAEESITWGGAIVRMPLAIRIRDLVPSWRSNVMKLSIIWVLSAFWINVGVTLSGAKVYNSVIIVDINKSPSSRKEFSIDIL
ncbi:hypothetical protein D3C78_1319130 [compost metagenome]